jgi:hypothetical protein
MLRDFLVDSGLGGDAASTGGDSKPRRRGASGVKTEGVLVGCRQTSSDDDSTSHPTVTEEVSEEDELIWWAWDGKLTGFAEW